jgi:hypothetical protein
MHTSRTIRTLTLAAAAAGLLGIMTAQADDKPAPSGAPAAAAQASGKPAHKPRHHHAPAAATSGTTTRSVKPQRPTSATGGGTQTEDDVYVGVR